MLVFMSFIALGGFAVFWGAIFFFLFSKYIFAGLSILFGDKKSLEEFGNLCDENISYKDAYWSANERRKPGDPPIRQWEQ